MIQSASPETESFQLMTQFTRVLCDSNQLVTQAKNIDSESKHESALIYMEAGKWFDFIRI